MHRRDRCALEGGVGVQGEEGLFCYFPATLAHVGGLKAGRVAFGGEVFQVLVPYTNTTTPPKIERPRKHDVVVHFVEREHVDVHSSSLIIKSECIDVH